MDSSSVQLHHHQEMSSQTLENMLVCPQGPNDQEKKPRPAEQAQKCPRCDSTNTKFCYYNNYSLSQPRYFCKSCRRYWTKGGTLRNVPVGGGCRKNKRSSSSSSKRNQDSSITNSPNYPVPSLTQSSYDHSSDLSLAFARLQKQGNGHLGIEENDMSMMFNQHGNTSNAPPSFLDALRGGFLETPQNGFHHNFYYGNNNMGQVENGGILGVNEEMGMNYDQEIMMSNVGVKQEMCNNMTRDENNKILWGFPWQINGDNHLNNMGDFESTNKQSWINGFGNSSWHHGLVNSTPLM